MVDVSVTSPKGTSSSPAGRFTYAPRTLSVFAGIPFKPGPATSTALGSPTDVAVDSAGNLYIADSYYSVIEKVTPDGTLSVVAGTGVAGTPVPGPATQSPLPNYSSKLAVDGSGNLYIGAPSTVLKMDSSGVLSVFANGLGYYLDLGTDAAGNLYVSSWSSYVTKITPSGTTSSIYMGIDGVQSLAVAPNGDIFFFSGGRIRKRTTDGEFSIVAGTNSAGPPVAGPATESPIYDATLAVDANQNVYARTSGFWGSRIVKVTGRTLSIVAGTATNGPPAPGPAQSSPFTFISSLAVDPAGTALFVADSGRGSSVDSSVDPPTVHLRDLN